MITEMTQDHNISLPLVIAVTTKSGFYETARAMKRANADVVLVSKDPVSRRIDAILRVLTMREILQHLKDVAELL